jgi:hypothetical protein
MRAVDAAAMMGERWGMRLLATIVTAMLFGFMAVAPSAAQSERTGARDAQAQSQTSTSRARTRLRVRPVYPYRRHHSLYPIPNNVVDYPGPNARRECAGALVTEYRLSGTVVVPRLRCHWVRG